MLDGMRITALAPMSVRSLAWRGPDPTVSLVVKVAFRLDRAAGMVPSDEIVPLERDVPSPDDPELHYQSDFVPWKGRAEVLLVGHAHADRPTRCVPVRIALGEVDKRCFALAGAEVSSVPLSSTYLRATPEGGAHVRVAPMPATIAGWAEQSLPHEIDYERFNGAPADQRLAAIEPGADLVLEGLVAGAPVFRTHVPRWRPTAYLAPRRPGRTVEPVRIADAEGWQPIALACDTLWIDVDHGAALMVWRGVVPAPRLPTEIIVDAANRGLDASEVITRLAQARAPSDTGPPPADDADTRPPPADDLQETTASLDWGEIAMKGTHLPFAAPRASGQRSLDAESPPTPYPPKAFGRPTGTLDEATGLLDLSTMGDALPFRERERETERAPPPPSAPTMARGFAELGEEATGVFDLAAQEPALPFEGRIAPPPPSAPTEVRPMPPSEEQTGILDFAAMAPAAALPFAARDESAPRAWKRATTLAIDDPRQGSTLPFAAGELPPHVASALGALEALGTDVARGATLAVDAAPASELPTGRAPDLPFVPPAGPAPAPPPPPPGLPLPRGSSPGEPRSPAPIAGRSLGALRAPRPAMPRLTPPTSRRASPAPTAPPAPRVPALPTLPMPVHGAIKAALLDGERLEAILAQQGVTERVWRLAERRLAIDIARDDREAKELAQDLDRAVAAARQERLAREDQADRDELDRYLAVRAEIDEADDPQGALDDLGMSRRDWDTMRRRWTRRALVDPALAETIRERLAKARTSLRRLAPAGRSRGA